jgi:hypothetical protein
LVRAFGEESVFMDVAGIAPGHDFRKAIDESVANCGALLAVIGPLWASDAAGDGTRRLDDANDFVRLEIASALTRDVALIPVLVRGATMPAAQELPSDLRELVFRNAVELSHASWRRDVVVLIDALRRIVATRDVVPPKAAAAIDPDAVQKVSSDLARYIGPIAGVVVKRAARRCSTLTELYEAVALEIERPADRAAFLGSRER